MEQPEEENPVAKSINGRHNQREMLGLQNVPLPSLHFYFPKQILTESHLHLHTLLALRDSYPSFQN